MKFKLQIFYFLAVALLIVNSVKAQSPNTSPQPSGTRVPIHTLGITQIQREGKAVKNQIVSVGVTIEGNRILGVRSLGERKDLNKNEISAKAVTDGDSMIIALESRFNNLDKLGIAIESEIILDEETSKALGSNVFSILDGKYQVQSRESPNPNDPTRQHRRVWTIMRPTPEHNIYKTLGLPGRGEFLEVEVSSLQNEKNTPKPVLVTIKNGNLLNIKSATGTEKVESKDVYPAKATFLNTQLVLQFNKPISREQKVEIRTTGEVISDKETAETLGFCACKEGNSIVADANTRTPTVKFPKVGKVKHHRWLFNKTKYINTTACEMFGQKKKWWL